MPTTIGLVLGVCIVLGLPAGAILLALGLFSRGPGTACVCGYSRSGLPAGSKCPECGGGQLTRSDIPRVRWQINVGIGLLSLAGLATLLFIALLVRMAMQHS